MALNARQPDVRLSPPSTSATRPASPPSLNNESADASTHPLAHGKPPTNPAAAASSTSVNTLESTQASSVRSAGIRDAAAAGPKDESELSEEELRRLFDDEEIERFLGLFADYVSEVALSDSSALVDQRDFGNISEVVRSPTQTPEGIGQIQPDVDQDWTPIDSNHVPPSSHIPPSVMDAKSISEYIAFRYVLPALPPARPRPERFTVGGLRLTIQRLYFVTGPAYGPFFSRLVTLASWKERTSSATYCVLFWTLWYYNLLMPAVFFRVLRSLVRRRLFPYPTLEELQERRREAAQAEALGEQLQKRLGSTSSSGIMEAWRLFRIFSKPNKAKVKQKKTKVQGKGKGGKGKENNGKENQGPSESTVEISETLQAESDEREVDEPTVLDNPHESQAEKDTKRAILNSLNDITDMHERVKNIFFWRKSSGSKVYAVLLIFLIIFTALLPTKYIVKLALFILGFLYWHIIPIIASLPPSDRERLPPLFENTPTDTEYAMELISQRIARGEDIRPAPRKKSKKPKNVTKELNSKSTTSLVSDNQTTETDGAVSAEEETALPKSSMQADRPGEIDWHKWGERAANMNYWAAQGRRWVGKNKSGDGAQEAPPTEQEPSDSQTRTFLAHHKASPGVISLTSTMFFYTPIAGVRPKIRIALTDMRGVKKIGIGAVPGLSIKWQKRRDSTNANSGDSADEREVLEERFRWVGGRDEVFARLVGWGGRKWMKV